MPRSEGHPRCLMGPGITEHLVQMIKVALSSIPNFQDEYRLGWGRWASCSPRRSAARVWWPLAAPAFHNTDLGVAPTAARAPTWMVALGCGSCEVIINRK